MPRKTKEESILIENKTKKPLKSDKKAVAQKATKSSKTKKPTSKKEVSKKSKKVVEKSVQAKTKKPDLVEYYDLPYRYNQTIVKILFQTPNKLFVYWDISDKDRKNFENTYGLEFFNITKPVLVIHNKTKNYTFEIDINDFANSWYFNINDEKCEYFVELGRRPKENNTFIPDNYIYVASSNQIETPNDHILFEKEQKLVFYRNVKTNMECSKDIATLNLLKYMGNSHSVNKLYDKIYKDEKVFVRNNPTSSFSENKH